METAHWIALSSFLISATTLVLGGISMRSSRERAELAEARRERDDMRGERDSLRAECARLREENLRLMREIFTSTENHRRDRNDHDGC